MFKMENVETHDQGHKSSKSPEVGVKTKVSSVRDFSDESVIIDIKDGVTEKSRNSESCNEEKVCRICHFGTELGSIESELIQLGCDCKGELGCSHQHCAEAWFTQRGNRICEICGKTAKNMRNNNVVDEETSIFMMELNEMRLVAATLDTSSDRSRRCKKVFFNFLLGCLVLAFVLPWLFRAMDLLPS